MIYEWDSKKAESNLKKHGVSFTEAASVFLDPMALTYYDPDHSKTENREITIGYSAKNRIIILSHCDRNETIRIISARKATTKERKHYEK